MAIMMDEERAKELERQRRVLKRNRQIPYELIDEAVAEAWVRHPDADEIKGMIYHNRVYVEVWRNGRADIEFE